jgi:hypothetical protein
MANRTILDAVVLTTALLISPPGVRAQQNKMKPQVALIVMDYAQVDPATAREAKRVASNIFARAGVDAIVTDQESGSGAPYPFVTFFVYIRENPEPYGFPPGTLGIAPGTAKERDRYLAYLFNREAIRLCHQAFIANVRIDKATVLGYAMVHEIGHVLLNQPGHSCDGVMKGKWTVNDIEKMSREWVNFDSRQAAKMQAEIRRRTRDEQSRMQALLPLQGVGRSSHR